MSNTLISVDVDVPSGWFHLVLNLIGSNDGLSVYHNGLLVANGTTSAADSSIGDGRIVIGRLSTVHDIAYGSVEIDELMLFNQALPEEQITMLSQLPN